MNKLTANLEQVEHDNPEWTGAMFDQATSLNASNLPNEFKLAVKQGRPFTAKPKQHISIRLSPDVLNYFKATGKGWQTRIDEALKEWVKAHPS